LRKDIGRNASQLAAISARTRRGFWVRASQTQAQTVTTSIPKLVQKSATISALKPNSMSDLSDWYAPYGSKR